MILMHILMCHVPIPSHISHSSWFLSSVAISSELSVVFEVAGQNVGPGKTQTAVM